MTSKERKRRSIRKAVQTRAANRASWKHYFKIDKPARQRLDTLLNYFLKKTSVSVRLNPLQDTELRLKCGVTYGRLIAVQGMTVIVQPEGYKHPRGYHYGFWEPLLP
jgi:hypothetical protein